jgi:predicted MFS family arabinose efflux permease
MAAGVCTVGIVSMLASESPAGAATTMVLNGSVLNLGAAGGASLCGILIALSGYSALAIGLPVAASQRHRCAIANDGVGHCCPS